MKHKINSKIFSIVMLCAFLLNGIVAFNLVNAEPKYPKPTELKYVNDYAKVIDSESAQYMLSVGKELEAKTGAQATVVVINSLEGETSQSFSNHFSAILILTSLRTATTGGCLATDGQYLGIEEHLPWAFSRSRPTGSI